MIFVDASLIALNVVTALSIIGDFVRDSRAAHRDQLAAESRGVVLAKIEAVHLATNSMHDAVVASSRREGVREGEQNIVSALAASKNVVVPPGI
jgi:hypothetical protein